MHILIIKNMDKPTPCTLNISSKNLDCEEVATFFQTHDIACMVTKNTSVLDQNTIEHGCKINILDSNAMNHTLWDKLKTQFDLTCAHLKKEKLFYGCIYDYFRKSNCPGC